MEAQQLIAAFEALLVRAAELDRRARELDGRAAAVSALAMTLSQQFAGLALERSRFEAEKAAVDQVHEKSLRVH